MFGYNGYDFDMMGSVEEMERIILEAEGGETAPEEETPAESADAEPKQPDATDADDAGKDDTPETTDTSDTEETSEAAPGEENLGKYVDEVCDWMGKFVGSDEGWAYITGKSDEAPSISAGSLEITNDVARESGSTTKDPKVFEYSDGKVSMGTKKFLTVVLSSDIKNLLKNRDKDEAIQKVILDVINGEGSRQAVHKKFRKAIADFMNGRRPPTRGVNRHTPHAEQVIQWVKSKPELATEYLGAQAKEYRKGGEVNRDEYVGKVSDELFKLYVQDNTGKGDQVYDDAKIIKAETDTWTEYVGQLADSTNALSDEDVALENAELGAKVIDGVGKSSEDGETTDTGSIEDRVWAYMTSDDKDKNTTFGGYAKSGRMEDGDGKLMPLPDDFFGDEASRSMIAATLAKETGVSADDVPDEDVDAAMQSSADKIAAHMEKLAKAIDELTQEELDIDSDARIGEIVTAKLKGEGSKKDDKDDKDDVDAKVWEYMISDDKVKNILFGTNARKARPKGKDGKYAEPTEGAVGEDTTRTIVASMLAKDSGTTPDKVPGEDIDATLAKSGGKLPEYMEKLSKAISELNNAEMGAPDDETLGEHVTKHLKGGSADKLDGWSAVLWNYLVSNDQGKNNALGEDCANARKTAEDKADEDMFGSERTMQYLEAAEQTTSDKPAGNAADIEDDDMEKCLDVMKKVAAAINQCSAEELKLGSDSKEKLGEAVTRHLVGKSGTKGGGSNAGGAEGMLKNFEAWYFGLWPDKGNSVDDAVKRVAALFSSPSFPKEKHVSKNIDMNGIVAGFDSNKADSKKAFVDCLTAAGEKKALAEIQDNATFDRGVANFFHTTLPTRYEKLRKSLFSVIDWEHRKVNDQWSDVNKRARAFVNNRVDTSGKDKDNPTGFGGLLDRLHKASETMLQNSGLTPVQ